MSDIEKEKQSMQDEFEKREAGVAEMMEFSEKVDSISARAAAAIAPPPPPDYTSDSTNLDIGVPDADLGRDPRRTRNGLGTVRPLSGSQLTGSAASVS